jgi:peptidoglycan/LPS O-acetylase OafA/YrhL
MIGNIRFAFAWFVVVEHLASNMPFFSHWGIFAVFGFYVISGYLMTRVLNESYRFEFRRFAVNRILRIYPLYYAVGLLTLASLAFTSEARAFYWKWPRDFPLIDWIGNILVIPMEFYSTHVQVVPTAWSLAVELINYLLLWAVVARSPWYALCAALLAAAYHIACLYLGVKWERLYFPFYAALLPFSLGACIYFLRFHLLQRKAAGSRKMFWLGVALGAANLVISGALGGAKGSHFVTCFYINLLAVTVIVGCVATAPDVFPDSPLSRWLGEMAYPIFLVHFIVAYAVSQWGFDGKRGSLMLFLASAVPILVVSYWMVRFGERWIEPRRRLIRSK